MKSILQNIKNSSPITISPSQERQQELEAAYEAQQSKTPDRPYQGVRICTLGELEWILEQRKWSAQTFLPKGYERANLSGVVLSDTNLSWCSLDDANLSGAVLSGANLRGSSLGGANLSEAELMNANLSGAVLFGANLSDAHLYAANLSRAILNYANLSGAHLRNANLSGAELANANLSGAVFSDTKLGNRRWRGVTVKGVNWDKIDLSSIDWAQIPYLGDEIQGDWRAPFELLLLGWSKDYDDHRESTRVYHDMTKMLRDQNLNDEANRYAYRAQICRRRMFFRKILSWPPQLPQYLFTHLLNLLAGYGYKPERSLFWYLVTIVGFA